MEPLLIEFFEPMIEMYDFDGAAIHFSNSVYDDSTKDTIWNASVIKAVKEGYLYPNQNNEIFRLTKIGKDFMRMVMI